MSTANSYSAKGFVSNLNYFSFQSKDNNVSALNALEFNINFEGAIIGGIEDITYFLFTCALQINQHSL